MKYLDRKDSSNLPFVLLLMFLAASALFAVLGLVVFADTQMVGIFMLVFVIFLLMALGISFLAQ